MSMHIYVYVSSPSSSSLYIYIYVSLSFSLPLSLPLSLSLSLSARTLSPSRYPSHTHTHTHTLSLHLPGNIGSGPDPSSTRRSLCSSLTSADPIILVSIASSLSRPLSPSPSSLTRSLCLAWVDLSARVPRIACAPFGGSYCSFCLVAARSPSPLPLPAALVANPSVEFRAR